MRRWTTFAAFLLFITILSASAQRGGVRGGGHAGGGFVAHGPVGHPVFSGVHSGYASRSFTHAEVFGERGFGFHDGFHGGFHHHHCFGCRRFGFPWWGYGYGAYYGGYYDPFYGDDYRFDEDQARDAQVANEMNYLNLREERLREREDALDREREEDAYARRQESGARGPQAQPASSQPAPATVLVFRDRHQQEVQNYAIADGTLWVLNEQSAKKIPIASLDLEATRRANDDRGVEFAMPSNQ
jgi:hypothetical protein